MNDPAPPFGRGGWVCAALLLGIFAGGGITWAVLSRRPVKAPLIVYQLPPPGALMADVPGAATDASPQSHGKAGNALAPQFGSHGPPLEDASNAVPEPGAVPGLPTGPAVPGDDTAPAPVEWNGSSDRLPLAALRINSDHLLHSRLKVEGCLADARSALALFLKKGFNLREKVWDGDVSLEEGRAVSCQLFKGNEYVFCAGTDAKGAKLSLQLYDVDGAPADAEPSSQELPAGASATLFLHCRQTGTYFVVVKLEAATQEKVPWGMVYAYR